MYRRNPYHNFRHAFDVTQTVFAMLTSMVLFSWTFIVITVPFLSSYFSLSLCVCVCACVGADLTLDYF